MIIDELFESPQQCPECGGISFSDLILAEKKDACYHKVKASAKVWPSAYASGRLVQCRKKGAANYGNKSEGVAENAGQPLSVQQLATISDEALDNAYGYGRSTPGNTFGWQANLKSAAYAKQMIDQGVTDIEAISDAIHKGWNTTAQAFVQDPEQFDDTAKLAAAGKLEAKLQQRAQLMKQNYAQLPEEEKEKDRVVARALLQAIRGEQGVAEAELDEKSVSQAQFRTMAGAAHNPEFARKVGISQDVAQEFNQADKKSNYKKLPARATEGSLEEVDRRGFLKGLGAAALAGAAGSAAAAPFKHTTDKDQMTGEKTANVSKVKSNDGKAVLELRRGADPMVVLEVPGAIFNAKTYGTSCRYKIGNGPVIKTLLAKPSSGAYDWGAILPSYEGGERLAEKIISHSGEVLFEVDLYKIGAKIFKFTIEQDAETIKFQKQDTIAQKKQQFTQQEKAKQSLETESAIIDLEKKIKEKFIEYHKEKSTAIMKGDVYDGYQRIRDKENKLSKFDTELYNAKTDKILGKEFPDWLISYSKTKQLPPEWIDVFNESVTQGVEEGEQQKGADYRDPKEVDYDDEYDAMVARVKKLAGLGPMKTVYDPTKRQYRNMPTAVQPKK